MPGPEKRLPGQSDADYGRSSAQPNAQFLGDGSGESGGFEQPAVRRAVHALMDLWQRRRDRRAPGR